jgi:hypothetical protein
MIPVAMGNLCDGTRASRRFLCETILATAKAGHELLGVRAAAADTHHPAAQTQGKKAHCYPSMTTMLVLLLYRPKRSGYASFS